MLGIANEFALLVREVRHRFAHRTLGQHCTLMLIELLAQRL
jgi:hypothetical protein